jgi:hypothetical protein
MRTLQGVWGRLKLRLPIDPDTRLEILSLIVKLHNFRTRKMKNVNQIATVYASDYAGAVRLRPRKSAARAGVHHI